MLLNSFSSYSPGSSDLSSVLGVSVDDILKIRDFEVNKTLNFASYSSPKNASLTNVLNVSGSGVFLGAYMKFPRSARESNVPILKITVDGKVLFYVSTKLSNTSSSSDKYILPISFVCGCSLTKQKSEEEYPSNGNNYNKRAYSYEVAEQSECLVLENMSTYSNYFDAPIYFNDTLRVDYNYYANDSEIELSRYNCNIGCRYALK